MKKVASLALLTTTLAFAQAGIMGGSEGLHQINAKTLGQWQVNLGTGGNISFGSWGLSRGGIYMDKNGKRYSFNDVDYSQAGNVFVSVVFLPIQATFLTPEEDQEFTELLLSSLTSKER